MSISILITKVNRLHPLGTMHVNTTFYCNASNSCCRYIIGYVIQCTCFIGASAAAANVNPLTRKSSGSEQKPEQMQSTGAHGVKSSIVVVPSRVPCGVRHTHLF